MSALRRSVLFSSADRYFAQALMIGTTAVMARLLTPAETGLFLLAQSFVLMAESFRDFGVGLRVVQAREATPELVRSAFTVTFCISLVTGALLFLGAGWLARFFDAPELKMLLQLSSAGFLIAPFGTPIIAIMRRTMAFGQLAAINIASSVIGAATTIGLGFAGAGAASYMLGYIAGGACVALAALAIRFEPWVFRPCFAKAGDFLSFGGISIATALLNLGYEMLPRMVIGRIVGFDALGIYSRALGLAQLPDRLIGAALYPVVLPALSKRVREGGNLKQDYLRGVALMSALVWPALTILALLAEPIVQIMLGPQWTEAAPIVRIVAVAYMAFAPAFLTFPTLVAIGRIRDTLTMSLISLPPSAALMIVVAHWGIVPLALSMLVLFPVQMATALWFIRRAIGLDWQELALSLSKAFVIASGTAVVPILLIASLPGGAAPDLVRTAAALVGAAAGWAVTAAAIRHPIWSEVVAVKRMVAGQLPGGRLRS